MAVSVTCVTRAWFLAVFSVKLHTHSENAASVTSSHASHCCYSVVSFSVAVLLLAIAASPALFRMLALSLSPFFFFSDWNVNSSCFLANTWNQSTLFILRAAFWMWLEVIVMSFLWENCAIWNWGFGRSVKEERIWTVRINNVFVL